MQRHAAKHLDIKVAHFHDALGAFANNRKSFRKDRIQRLPFRYAIFELLSFRSESVIGQCFKLRIQVH